MGYKARHPTANFLIILFFVSIKNPFALFIFFFPAHKTKKIEEGNIHTCNATTFLPFFPFLLRRRFRPTGIKLRNLSRYFSFASVPSHTERSRFSFRSFRSFFFGCVVVLHMKFILSSLFTPQQRTSFWVWVFFFFFNPHIIFSFDCMFNILSVFL